MCVRSKGAGRGGCLLVIDMVVKIVKTALLLCCVVLLGGAAAARKKKTWDQKIPSPPSSVAGKRRALLGGEPAAEGVPFISQPFDPDRLATVNTYDDTQSEFDAIRELDKIANSLGNAKITVASWEPRILVVDDFLTPEEADHMVSTIGSGKRLGSTAVVTTTGGAAVLAETVTSKIGTFPAHDPVVDRINDRISQLSFIPKDWGEPLHVLHYDPGQYFRGHLDVHAKPGRRTSSRVATCFLYLSDVEAGGETHFPLAKKADGTRDPVPEACRGMEGKDASKQGADALDKYYDGSEFFSPSPEELAELGLTVQPKKGRAVLWWNKAKNGDVDWRSRHVGCPLVAGEKWAATRWIHHQSMAFKG